MIKHEQIIQKRESNDTQIDLQKVGQKVEQCSGMLGKKIKTTSMTTTTTMMTTTTMTTTTTTMMMRLKYTVNIAMQSVKTSE